MKNAKKSLFLLILFSISISVFAQNSGAQAAASDNAVSSEAQITLNLADDNNAESNLSVTGGQKQSAVWPFIKMFLILAVLVAAIYGVIYFIKRNVNKTVDEDQYLRRVAFLNLAPGKSVEVITLLEHAYIVGVSDAGINLISEVDDKELVEAMNLNSDKNRKVTKPKNFREELERIFPGVSRNNENIFEGSEQNVSEVLKSQRSKLNRGEGTDNE